MRFWISKPARTDLETILAVSLERWGDDGVARYVTLLDAAFQAIAANPGGPTTRDRNDLLPGIRSFHLRDARHRGAKGRDPVHIVFYRTAEDASVEIVRVLHERMDPTLHFHMPPRRAPR